MVEVVKAGISTTSNPMSGEYVVKAGDTLSGIVQKMRNSFATNSPLANIKTTELIRAIMTLNKLTDINVIKAGTRLSIKTSDLLTLISNENTTITATPRLKDIFDSAKFCETKGVKVTSTLSEALLEVVSIRHNSGNRETWNSLVSQAGKAINRENIVALQRKYLNHKLQTYKEQKLDVDNIKAGTVVSIDKAGELLVGEMKVDKVLTVDVPIFRSKTTTDSVSIDSTKAQEQKPELSLKDFREKESKLRDTQVVQGGLDGSSAWDEEAKELKSRLENNKNPESEIITAYFSKKGLFSDKAKDAEIMATILVKVRKLPSKDNNMKKKDNPVFLQIQQFFDENIGIKELFNQKISEFFSYTQNGSK